MSLALRLTYVSSTGCLMFMTLLPFAFLYGFNSNMSPTEVPPISCVSFSLILRVGAKRAARLEKKEDPVRLCHCELRVSVAGNCHPPWLKWVFSSCFIPSLDSGDRSLIEANVCLSRRAGRVKQGGQSKKLPM